MLRRTVFALAVVLAGAGLAGQASGQTVTPGAFCSPAGATGVTVDNTPMVCTTTATDDRNRWRQAGPTTTTIASPATTTTVFTGTGIISITPAPAPAAPAAATQRPITLTG